MVPRLWETVWPSLQGLSTESPRSGGPSPRGTPTRNEHVCPHGHLRLPVGRHVAVARRKDDPTPVCECVGEQSVARPVKK